MKEIEDYYLRQAGSGLPAFVGSPVYQRGHGLGNIFSGLAKMIVPVLKTAGKKVLRQGLQSGTEVLGDVLEGRNFKKAVKRRSKEAGTALLSSAAKALSAPPPYPHPPPPGVPIKRRKTSKKRQSKRSSSNRDIFS